MPKAYSIVGTIFTGTPESFMMELQPGEPATLVREPTNQHDPNAIAVWIGGRKVGYVPRKQNAVLASFIDQAGKPILTPVDGAPPSYSDIATDQASVASSMAIEAKFIRSPNSNYPMVEI